MGMPVIQTEWMTVGMAIPMPCPYATTRQVGRERRASEGSKAPAWGCRCYGMNDRIE